jgi:superfamily II DNA or RNA helicase
VSIAEHAWWPARKRALRVMGSRELWGHEVIDAIDLAAGLTIRLNADDLAPIGSRPWLPDEVTWRAAACRVLAARAAGQPLAAVAAGVELLPHQGSTVRRALGLDPVRLAICDEVGLGKTVTAAAITAELKAQDRARRILVVAPKGVQLQWVAEFADRFGEEFVRVGPEGMPVDAGVDPWRVFPQVVCSLDSIKPIRTRAGWSAEQVAEYNRRRVDAIVAAGWDLVIFDEAHHVAGSSDVVARHKLARELCASVSNVLLLSATPHSGKSDGFRRFIGLLDDGFLAGAPLTREVVQSLVARTEKRSAVDARGQALFTPRTTTMEVVRYGDRVVERELYEAVTEYVREGYGRAVRERRPAIGFLVLLMQRLVSSSTAAILAALERRAAALDATPEQLQLSTFSSDWDELTGEEQLERLIEVRGHGWASERAEVHELLQLARRAASHGLDAKLRHFFDLVQRVQSQARDADVKILVFTEFLQTQEMLLDAMEGAGVTTVAINGGMSLAERTLAQRAFEAGARVLVSTDAGGEGINLQFAHVVVNWDLPWTPTKIEQRIGRVDRIGQDHPVTAFNLVRENSIDLRVLEVLEQKLATILSELGADKRGDVLESLSARSERLYVDAILEPGSLERSADAVTAATRDDVISQAPTLDLITHGRDVQVSPDAELDAVVRRAHDAWSRLHGHRDEKSHAFDALRELPEAVPGEPVPAITGAPVSGWWACFEVSDDQHRRACFALFAPDEGLLVRPDIAERCWSQLVAAEIEDVAMAPERVDFDRLLELGRDHGYRTWGCIAHGGVPSLVMRLLVRVTQ